MNANTVDMLNNYDTTPKIRQICQVYFDLYLPQQYIVNFSSEFPYVRNPDFNETIIQYFNKVIYNNQQYENFLNNIKTIHDLIKDNDEKSHKFIITYESLKKLLQYYQKINNEIDMIECKDNISHKFMTLISILTDIICFDDDTTYTNAIGIGKTYRTFDVV